VSVPASAIQCARDRALREELVVDYGVKLAVRKLEERTSGYGLRTRRRLLTRGLRLTRGVAPALHAALASCRELLGFDEPVELYVVPDSSYQAFCAQSLAGPIMVGFGSRLLETFSEVELKFVLGHELGHALFDHFGIPMPATATLEDVGGRFVTRPVQLKLYLWCRAAEVSADRTGLVCAGDVEAGARALLKIASGLTTEVVRPDLAAFTAQVDALLAAPAACAEERHEEDTLDCFDTHPYSPVRVRALLAFSRSRPFHAARGEAASGIDAAELEALVERELAVMEPSYLEDPSELSESMRRLLYCAGICVASANGVISAAETKALRALLGAKRAPVPEDVEAVKRELPQRLEEGRAKMPFVGRVQIVQHATIVAAADGVVEPSELDQLTRIAEGLAVDPGVIAQTLAGAAAPMD
jgi:tellurite resistance protein